MDNYKPYSTGKWKRLRQVILDRDNGLCQHCLRGGRTNGGNHVHHIKPWLEGKNDAERERLFYDVDNLEVVCEPCHIEIHKELQPFSHAEKELTDFAEAFLGLDRRR